MILFAFFLISDTEKNINVNIVKDVARNTELMGEVVTLELLSAKQLYI
jgi:hypothetical protein